MRALVVEDNPALANGISTALERRGLAVDVVHDGLDADGILRVESFDVVILDLSLPGCDGLEVLKNLRARGNNTQVMILTARDQLPDRVSGLDLGADDYMVKPFELVELEARVRALLRRSNGNKSPVIEVGALQFDSNTRTVLLKGEALDLPKRELCLIELLVMKAGKVISKNQIAESLAGFDDEITSNAIELYVSRLRKKLSGSELKIKTVRGLGYLLEKP
ncbi:response regulator transcription factor [Kiloniella sp. b19]|uniref:response regulator transcription factor n=1 Tax=Kiloniella sp. GXU_MW_B19 TaxID=3141326 RepID=UPI0031E0DB98